MTKSNILLEAKNKGYNAASIFNRTIAWEIDVELCNIQKWLIREHKLNVISPQFSPSSGRWYGKIQVLESNPMRKEYKYFGYFFDSYEEAFVGTIQKALNLLP